MSTRLRPIQHSFQSGELSPDSFGRFDATFYRRAVKTLKNFSATPFGSIDRRDATRMSHRFLHTTEDAPERPVALDHFQTSDGHEWRIMFRQGGGFPPFFPEPATEQSHVSVYIVPADLEFTYAPEVAWAPFPIDPNELSLGMEVFAGADFDDFSWLVLQDTVLLFSTKHWPLKLIYEGEGQWSDTPVAVSLTHGPYTRAEEREVPRMRFKPGTYDPLYRLRTRFSPVEISFWEVGDKVEFHKDGVRVLGMVASTAPAATDAPRRMISVNTTADTFQLLSGSTEVGRPVFFTEGDGATLPSPLETGKLYYVVSVDPNGFEDVQVSEEKGGSPVDLMDTGDGDFFFNQDVEDPELSDVWVTTLEDWVWVLPENAWAESTSGSDPVRVSFSHDGIVHRDMLGGFLYVARENQLEYSWYRVIRVDVSASGEAGRVFDGLEIEPVNSDEETRFTLAEKDIRVTVVAEENYFSPLMRSAVEQRFRQAGEVDSDPVPGTEGLPHLFLLGSRWVHGTVFSVPGVPHDGTLGKEAEFLLRDVLPSDHGINDGVVQAEDFPLPDVGVPREVLAGAFGWFDGGVGETAEGGYGYPNFPLGGEFHGNRLFLFGSPVSAQEIHVSELGNLFSFSPVDRDGQILDTSGFSFTPLSSTFETVRWITSRTDLMIGTDRGVWIISEEDAVGISPRSFSVRRHSTFGTPVQRRHRLDSDNAAASVFRGMDTPSGVMHVGDGGSAVYLLRFSFELQAYASDDITAHVKHLFRDDPIIQAVFLKLDTNVIEVLTQAGKVYRFSWDEDREMAGWSRVESEFPVAALGVRPSWGRGEASRDRIFYVHLTSAGVHIVSRNDPFSEIFLDGHVRRDASDVFEAGGEWFVAVNQDYGGHPLAVFADGVFVGMGTVPIGGADLKLGTSDPGASEYVIGLLFESLMETLPVDVIFPDFNTFGRRRQLSRADIRVRRGRTFYPGLTPDALRQGAQLPLVSGFDALDRPNTGVTFDVDNPLEVDQAAEPFDGVFEYREDSDYAPDSREKTLVLAQKDPFPLSILAIAIELGVTD